MYQAGTLSGNPLAMAAGIATLEQVRAEGFYDRLEDRSAALAEGLAAAARDAGCGEAVCLNRVGSMLCVFFAPAPVTDYASATAADARAYARFFHGLLDAGVNLAPSGYEAMFVSAAHTDADVAATVAAARHAFAAAANVMD